MDRLFSFIAKPIVLLAIVVSVFGPFIPANLPTAHADTPNPNNLNDNRNSLAAGQTTTNPTAYANTNGTDLQCNATSGIGLAICVSGFVYWITVGLGSWIAGITAYVFDYAVQLSLVSGAYAFDFINIGWGIVRDVANMSFLFILIYIAFKIMFQAETAGTMRMLVWVVIIALLVNFSFLMTRLVIDAGNIVALQFYNAIAPPGSPTIQNTPTGSGNSGTADITATIMNALNPQAIIGTNGFNNFVQNQNQSAMYYLIVSSIVFIMTGVSLFMLAAVFIFAALRFMMRIIGLWFVIIAAPAAFVAAIFRGREGGAKWFNIWLGYLLEFSFYPAVFLFMFYIEVRFLQEMNGTALFNNLYNATATSQDFSVIARAAASVSIRLGFILSTMYLILRTSQWTGEAFKKVGTTWVQNRLAGIGRGTLRLGTQGVLGGARFATQPIRSGIQSQANAATRTGVNSTLWRSINRAVGGTNKDKPQQFGGAGIGNTYGSALNSVLRRQPAAGQTQAGAQAQGSTQNTQTNTAQNQPQNQQTQANQQTGITNVQTPAIPTGARRLPGGAPITQVQGGEMNLPAGGAPMTINAQRAIQGLYRQAAAEKIMRGTTAPNAQQAQQTAQAATVGINLVTTPANMNRSESARPAQDESRRAPSGDVRALRDEIRGLGQSVRDAVAAAKNGTAMPQKVVVSAPTTHLESAPQSHVASGNSGHMSEDDISKIAKKIAHKLEPSMASHTPEPTPPTPAAPAAARPQQVNNDNNLPSNPDIGGMQPVPKAA